MVRPFGSVSKDELVLQSAFSDMETFYDTIVLPPPPRKPKGKPTVENHVRFLETHLVEELKKNTYTSLEEMNAAVKKIVADINQRPFQKKSDIRKSRMNGFERKLDGQTLRVWDFPTSAVTRMEGEISESVISGSFLPDCKKGSMPQNRAVWIFLSQAL